MCLKLCTKLRLADCAIYRNHAWIIKMSLALLKNAVKWCIIMLDGLAIVYNCILSYVNCIFKFIPHTCKGCLYAEDLKVFIEEYKRWYAIVNEEEWKKEWQSRKQ